MYHYLAVKRDILINWLIDWLIDWLRRGRLADPQYRTVTLSNWQKHAPEVFYKKHVLKNFAIITGKHLCWSLSFINLLTFTPLTLFKRDSNVDAFPIRNFCETPDLKNICLTAASELTLQSDCFELCSWKVTFKTILTQ